MYLPLLMMGLLVVLWVVSEFLFLGIALHAKLPVPGDAQTISWVTYGNVSISHYPAKTAYEVKRFYARPYGRPPQNWSNLTGRFIFDNRDGYLNIHIPIACLLTGLLPFAFGPFIAYRFRLWHYLGYTALIAVELAYYLRWQQ
jgi:hypothetical protein